MKGCMLLLAYAMLESKVASSGETGRGAGPTTNILEIKSNSTLLRIMINGFFVQHTCPF